MRYLLLIGCLAAIASVPTQAASIDSLIQHYAQEAQATTPNLSQFEASEGETLYFATFTTGKADTPSCTACHGQDPRQSGETRAGKRIEPMAVSANGQRYTDLKKTEKWFRRNCKSVLGRECTAIEKGNFLLFMKNS